MVLTVLFTTGLDLDHLSKAKLIRPALPTCADEAGQASASLTSALTNGTLLGRLRSATGLPISRLAFTPKGQPTTINSAHVAAQSSSSGEQSPRPIHSPPACMHVASVTLDMQLVKGAKATFSACHKQCCAARCTCHGSACLNGGLVACVLRG